MVRDLSNYNSVQTNLFVKMDIPNYQQLTFTDYYRDYSFSGDTYQSLGELLSVSSSDDELRVSPKELSMSISAIPDNNVTEVLNNKVKGSSVEIYRGFFDPSTSEVLTIGNQELIDGKFRGIVTNYEITDDLEMGESTGTFTIVFTITSIIELLNNKVNGRRTNPVDFPNQRLMDRVSALAKSNFNFGAPK